jgi:CRISPR-associated endonuclease Csn1
MEMQRRYALGLDLGVASIGWAIALLDEKDEVTTIERIGTFVYPSPIAEVDKGRRVTNRSNRGAKRRQRHRLDHFQARRKKLYKQLIELGWFPKDPEEQQTIRHREVHLTGNLTDHPIALKVAGLSRRLEPYELGKILLHYQRHRGYLSTAHLPALLGHKRPPELLPQTSSSAIETEEEKEARNLNAAIKQTRDHLDGITVSQFQWSELQNEKAVRATKRKVKDPKTGKLVNGDLRTNHRFDRWMYIDEFDQIWRTQAPHHQNMTEDLKRELESLVFHQMPLESKKDVVGSCQFIPTQTRCRNAELVFQRSRILQYLNNLTIRDYRSLDPRILTPEERQDALNLLLGQDKVSWPQLRQAVNLPNEEAFSDEPPPSKKGSKKAKSGGRDFVKGSAWAAQIAKILDVPAQAVAEGAYDQLVHDLISIPERQPNQKKTAELDTLRNRLINHYGLAEATAEALIALEPPKGYSKVCSRVLRRTEPHLLKGIKWHDALTAAGYKHAYEQEFEVKDKLIIAKDWSTGNPSVDAAVRWSSKVINQVVARYGKPAIIRVELPRSMAMGNEQRAEMWQGIKDREKQNQEYAKKLEDNGLPARQKYIKMLKLWDEAGHVSPYDPQTPIPDIRTLIEHYDLDHIVPKSYSAEDDLGNLTICPRSMNLEKGGRTPFEAWGNTPRWELIKEHVTSCGTIKKYKRNRILATERPEGTMEKRMLASIGYVGREMMQQLETLVGRGKVQVTNGSITSQVRHLWGMNGLLPKVERKGLSSGEFFGDEKNRDDLRHHAIDAACVVLIDRKLGHALTRYYQQEESWRPRRAKGESADFELAWPYANFKNHMKELIRDCPVVRPPSRQLTGALHKETMQPLADYVDISGPPNTFEVRAGQIMRFGPEGQVTGVWEKSTVHHGLIYKTISGTLVKPRSVSLFEVAKRVAENTKAQKRGERQYPIIRPELGKSVVEKFVMSLSNQDTVEYQGDKGTGPGFYRVGTVAVGEKSWEISLFPTSVARSDPKAPESIRVLSMAELGNIHGRVIQNIFGEVIFREPSSEH